MQRGGGGEKLTKGWMGVRTKGGREGMKETLREEPGET